MTTITYIGYTETDAEFTVEIDADVIYEKAVVSGPWENCSPGYSEIEQTGFRIIKNVDGVAANEISQCLDNQAEEIDEMFLDQYMTDTAKPNRFQPSF